MVDCGVNGYVYPVGDIEALSRAILEVYEKKMANRFDEVRDRSMGLAKPFTFEACADTYATAIVTLAAGKEE